ncbi:MAG: hypothetical protein OXC40_05390 [Proteobacteria bacterium]|nr:hypothetical protein [Pseudomonadota bacterium]
MRKINSPLANTVLVLLCFVFTSCRLIHSSATELMEGPVPYNKKTSWTNKENCFAWKFYLAATLHNMVAGTENFSFHQHRKLYIHLGKENMPPYPHEQDYRKLMPKERLQEILDYIIEQEGGTCSRELLYQTPCIIFYDYTPGRNRGYTYAAIFNGYPDVTYFLGALGMPPTKQGMIATHHFLLDHQIAQFPNVYSEFVRLKCNYLCQGNNWDVKYVFANNFGLCMLKKHQHALKQKHLFDFTAHDDYRSEFIQKIVEPSFQSFVKRSDELSGKLVE